MSYCHQHGSHWSQECPRCSPISAPPAEPDTGVQEAEDLGKPGGELATALVLQKALFLLSKATEFFTHDTECPEFLSDDDNKGCECAMPAYREAIQMFLSEHRGNSPATSVSIYNLKMLSEIREVVIRHSCNEALADNVIIAISATGVSDQIIEIDEDGKVHDPLGQVPKGGPIREGAPAASPDSAPSLWIWEPDEESGGCYGWICSNGQRITDLIPREYNFSALHNATLPTPCGSEASGVEKAEKDLGKKDA